MGISIWQSNKEQKTESTSVNLLSIDETALQKNQILNDILLFLDVSYNEIEFTLNTIKFELFNWSFSDTHTIKLSKQQLITPPLNIIANSIELKKQLWQLLLSIK